MAIFYFQNKKMSQKSRQENPKKTKTHTKTQHEKLVLGADPMSGLRFSSARQKSRQETQKPPPQKNCNFLREKQKNFEKFEKNRSDFSTFFTSRFATSRQETQNREQTRNARGVEPTP